MDTVVIMHISDLHFGIPENENSRSIANRETILEKFISCFGNIPTEWKPDILVVSGDIGWSGQKTDYQKAEKFFHDFLGIKGQKIRETDVITCIGNHDANYTRKMKHARPKAGAPIYDDDMGTRNSDNLDVEPINVSELSENFLNYEEFCTSMNFSTLSNSLRSSYTYGYRNLKGIDFVIMNTEWDFFGKDDKKGCEGRLRMGENLLHETCQYLKKEMPPRIIVYHRPLSCLHVSEKDNDKNELNKNVANLIADFDISLIGHTHQSDSETSMLNHKIINSGALHCNDVTKFVCGLIKISDKKEEPHRYLVEYAQYKCTKKLSRAGQLNDVEWDFNNNPDELLNIIESYPPLEPVLKGFFIFRFDFTPDEGRVIKMFCNKYKQYEEAKKNNKKVKASLLFKELRTIFGRLNNNQIEYITVILRIDRDLIDKLRKEFNVELDKKMNTLDSTSMVSAKKLERTIFSKPPQPLESNDINKPINKEKNE